MKLIRAKIKQFFLHRFFFATIGGALLAELILVAFWLIHPDAKFDGKIGVAAFTGIPLLVIAVFQLSRNLRLQRADFVKEYIGKFLSIKNSMKVFTI